MNKEEMIRKLVAHSVKTALSESKHYWLNDLFEKGFTGYRNLSRGQLKAELQMRGLSTDDEDDAYARAGDLDDLDADLDTDLDGDLAGLGLDDFGDASFDLPLRAGEAE